ncbi:hypothetical protein ACP70R_034626 [Stipagrostis hirtigluma subsp. patula]
MENCSHDPADISMDGFKVVLPAHPLISHWVSVLRDRDTPSHAFRSAMGELGRLLIYEATRDWLPTVTREIQSPMGTALVESVNQMEPIMIVPILRAGLALADLATSILPCTRTFHLGMARDETTLLPSVYLNKSFRLGDEEWDTYDTVLGTGIAELDQTVVNRAMAAVTSTMAVPGNQLEEHGRWLQWPHNRRGVAVAPVQEEHDARWLPENFSKECHILLMDPMLATGGTVAAAVDLLMERGAEISQIRIISAVAAPPALKKLNQRFPGFIVPGLGDAGDRSYGT